MKLNFWQWLGVALLAIGALLYFRRHANPPTSTVSPAVTQPAATPGATPSATQPVP